MYTFLLLPSICLAITSAYAQSSVVDAYIAVESPIAKNGLLANIGPTGSKAQGAKAGIVIASPTNTSAIPYLFTWTRDSSLVFKTIIDRYTLGLDTTTRTHIDDFILAESNLQQVSNPSGTISSGGLGEPKFNIDETAFTGPWGRPQRDGPALRSTAIITYANWLLQNGNSSYVTSKLWPIIKLDLDYVSTNWNQATFDLWEEISSSSFFTTAAQHRALREGAALAATIGQSSAGYTTQADNVLCLLQSYWNPSGAFATANTGGGRSGHDANTVLASIHTFDVAAGCDSITFQPCSDKALASLLAYVNSFRSVYSINSGISNNAAIATGRYPEDVYQGGNPWYLTTLAVAEQLYDALLVWKAQGSLSVTSISLAFFQLFQPSVAIGTYASTTTTFITLTTGIKNYADGFVQIVAKYTPSNGALSEQYSKSNGAPLSASDLTWSYASALTAFMARAGTVPASWGAKGLTSSCVAVTFNVQATTVFGENIYIIGSIDALHNWDANNAIILSAASYPIWSVTINLPASTSIQYKYIRILNDAVTWESDPNMQIITLSSGAFVANDAWR